MAQITPPPPVNEPNWSAKPRCTRQYGAGDLIGSRIPRHRGEPEGHPMTNQIDALNAMAVLVADRNYQGAVDIAVCLDHERLAEITVALVRMCAVSQIEFFHCQDLSENQARGQAAAFFRAGLGFPQKDCG
jgi:hypothetical protein